MNTLPNFNLDEIVFEKREKHYGAYFLRKQYTQNLVWAFLAASVMIIATIGAILLWGKWADAHSTSQNAFPPPPKYTKMPSPYPSQHSNTLTFLLEKDHKITYWRGKCQKDKLKTCDFNTVSSIILEHKQNAPFLSTDCAEEENCTTAIFVIKSRYNAQYKDFIRLLDILFQQKANVCPLHKFTKEDSLEILGLNKNIPTNLPPDSFLKTSEPNPKAFVCLDENAKPLNFTEVRNKMIPPLNCSLVGQVTLKILVDENGKYVRHIVSNPAHPLLLTEVEKHVTELYFSPPILNGKPIKAWLNLPFKFGDN